MTPTSDITHEELSYFLGAGADHISDDLRDRVAKALEEEPDGWVAREIEEACRYARNALNVDWSQFYEDEPLEDDGANANCDTPAVSPPQANQQSAGHDQHASAPKAKRGWLRQQWSLIWLNVAIVTLRSDIEEACTRGDRPRQPVRDAIQKFLTKASGTEVYEQAFELLLKAAGDFVEKSNIEAAELVLAEVVTRLLDQPAKSLAEDRFFCWALTILSECQARTGDFDAARARIREANIICANAYGNPSHQLGDQLHSAATMLQGQGDGEGALEFAEQAVRVWGELVGEWHPRLVQARQLLRVLEAAGEPKAKPEVMQISEATLPGEEASPVGNEESAQPVEYWSDQEGFFAFLRRVLITPAYTMLDLWIESCCSHKDYEGALAALDISLTFAAGSRLQVQTQYQQGVLRRYIGDFEGAERALLEACSAARDFGMRDAHIRALCAIGGLYNQLERYEEANEHLTRALALQRGEKISKSTEEIALTLNAMAVALFYQGDYQRAILCLEEANVDVRKWLGEGHVLEGVILVNASEVYRKLRRDEEADAAKEKGMSILQRCLDADHAAFSEAPGVVTVQFRSKKTTYVADLVVVG